MAVEMQGACVRCDKRTSWYPSDGWVFHVQQRHWRCAECRCATQPHLFLPPLVAAAVVFQEARRRAAIDEVFCEIEV